jgi:hypothetical protein
MAKGSKGSRGSKGGKFRSAVNGKYVSKYYAVRHPRTTVKESK